MGALLTIPANLPFLDTLARGLLDRDLASGNPLAAGEPDRLADTILLLPSRRACLAMHDALQQLAGGRPIMLPRLLPIGEPDEAELLLDPSLDLELPPALASVERRLLLTRLVLARDSETTHEQAIRLAGALEEFLDELLTEEVELDTLAGLVPLDLAEHWQTVLRFLTILSEAWPAVLAERKRVEPVRRRRLLLDALARRWTERPPSGPVIAAGISGSIPAVARLLGVILGLPHGRVVLPGLDLAMAEEDWQEVGNTPSHPQYPLHRLLHRMERDRTVVTVWPGSAVGGCAPERMQLLAEAMRPAKRSESWRHLPPPAAAAVQGLSLIEAPDLGTEAMQIALRLREVLETPGRRAMLVTPDRNLARRVAAELARFDLAVDDSGGVPLDQSPPGTFLLLTAHMIIGRAAPVPLLSALKHPFACGHSEQGSFRRHVRALERALLRGPRPSGGLDGMLNELKRRQADQHWPVPIAPQELAAWLQRLREAAGPFMALAAANEARLGDLLEAHLAFAEWLASDETGEVASLWAREAGNLAHAFIDELRASAAGLRMVPVRAYPALLAVLMGRQSVRLNRPGHPRVVILGVLESRLVQADLVILGGLNEGVWPRLAEAGPWLNRAMRRELGLPPVEQAIGIAAHDFLMASGAPELVLSRARKDESGAPTSPSRWLARLRAVLRATGQAAVLEPSQPWLEWARTLDQPRLARWPLPIRRPRPCPPCPMRPRELWATDVQDLMRDPYAVYARRILALKPLDEIDADPGAAERGQIIHRALEKFVHQFPDALPDDPLAELVRIGGDVFHREMHRPQVRAIWWPRFMDIARWFVVQERQRRAELVRIVAEIRGTLVIEAPGGPVSVRARADRIEVARSGAVRIIDYKTGRLPKSCDVRSGVAPQIGIEAAIAFAAGFEQVALQSAGSSAVEAVMLWGLTGGADGGKVLDPTCERSKVLVSTADLAEQAREGLLRLLAWFDDAANPYLPVPRPEIAPTHSVYEHLARVEEWRGSEEPADG